MSHPNPELILALKEQQNSLRVVFDFPSEKIDHFENLWKQSKIVMGNIDFILANKVSAQKISMSTLYEIMKFFSINYIT